MSARSLALLGDFGTRPGQEIDLHRTGYLFVLTRESDVAVFERAAQLAATGSVRSGGSGRHRQFRPDQHDQRVRRRINLGGKDGLHHQILSVTKGFPRL